MERQAQFKAMNNNLYYVPLLWFFSFLFKGKQTLVYFEVNIGVF